MQGGDARFFKKEKNVRSFFALHFLLAVPANPNKNATRCGWRFFDRQSQAGKFFRADYFPTLLTFFARRDWRRAAVFLCIVPLRAVF